MSRQEVNILSMDAFQKVMRHQGIKPRTISVCSENPLATGTHWPQENSVPVLHPNSCSLSSNPKHYSVSTTLSLLSSFPTTHRPGSPASTLPQRCCSLLQGDNRSSLYRVAEVLYALLSFTPDQHAVEQGLDPEQAADSGPLCVSASVCLSVCCVSVHVCCLGPYFIYIYIRGV